MNHFLIGCCMLTMVCSCKDEHEATAKESAKVKDSVTRMMTRISEDLTKGGPAQWPAYFEDDPAFFMASDGAVKFSDYPSAITYTRDTLPRLISHISLTWMHLRVDPLDREFASIGADFSEDIMLTGGQAIAVAGFFSAIAHFNGTTWKLRHLNWAIKPR
jgi:hypothetical protein